MSYQIKFTATAKEDLKKLAIYIAEESKDREVALRFINKLRETCERLKEFPDSGANPTDRVLLALGYKFVTHNDYLLFYTVDKENKVVYINAVFNGRMDYVKLLKSRI